MFRSILLTLVALPCLVHGQQATYDIYYGGTKAGESIAEISADGKVNSKMNLKIGSITVTSAMSGLIKKGILTECESETNQAGNVTKVSWKNDKFTFVSGGKVAMKDSPYKASLTTAFSIFHPILNSLLWSGMNGTAAKKKTLFVDSFAELDVEFKGRSQTVTVGGKPLAVQLWSGDIGTTKIEIAFSTDGKSLGVDVPSQKISWVLHGYDGIFVDPLAKYPELSQPTHQVVTERRVRMTTRDGVKLMADITRPNDDKKYPTILIRTPYGRAASLGGEDWYAKRGYVVVSQDVRGRGGSDGEWDPLVHERADGKDTLDWIVAQPWSDGKVGMIGGSYLGYVQWAVASTGHPALKCIIPQVSPPQPDMNFPWDHGSFMLLGDLWWCRVVKDRSSTTANAFAPLTNLNALKSLPLTTADDKFFGEDIPFFDRWLKRPKLSDWGDVFTTQDVAKVNIPALHVSGTWDGDGIGTAMHWSARKGKKDWLVFGPWTHLFNSSHKFGDQEYGAHGIIELEPLYLRFFDTWLKDRTVKLDEEPRVQFFATGSNKWIQTSDWPMPGAQLKTYYLSSGAPYGKLGSAPGSRGDSYVYNPMQTQFKASEVNVDVTGTTTVVPYLKQGDKSLTYRTEPFKETVTLAGSTTLELYISSTAKDATFNALVIDEDEKGVARYVGLPGTQRATYVDGQYKLLTPGKVVKVTIEPWWFAHEFKAGHRLVVVVNSDAYPRFARNPGTGEPDWKAKMLITATHTIWSTKKYPSKLTIWQLPK